MIDYTIGIGNIVEICVIAGGGIASFSMLRGAVVALKANLDEMKKETKADIAGIQSEIKKIGDVLINQADQNRRIIHLEDDIREMKHYRGFVHPAEPHGL